MLLIPGHLDDGSYTQLPVLELSSPPTLHAKKGPRPSQLASYTPLQIVPLSKQEAFACARVEYAVRKKLFLQWRFLVLVHEPLISSVKSESHGCGAGQMASDSCIDFLIRINKVNVSKKIKIERA